MENPSTSERITAVRSDNDPEPVRAGIGVDGEWEHQRVRKDAPRCESAEACTFLVHDLTLARYRCLSGYYSLPTSPRD